MALLLLGGCVAPPTPAGPTTDPFLSLLVAGDALAARGRRTAAEEVYRQAAALHPADPTPHLRLARLYQEWNRPQEGLAAVEQADRLGAPPSQVEPLRVALYADLENWESVLSHGITALQHDPTDRATRHRVAWAYLVLEEIEQAIAEYGRLLENDPLDPLANERMGVLLALRDPDAAIPYLQVARTSLASDVLGVLERGGDPAYRLAQIGGVCLRHAEPALAVPVLREAIALRPTYADAHALLGQALGMMGRDWEALDHLKAAVELAPRSPLAQSLLGLYYLDRGDSRVARSYLETAYDLDPENPAFSLYIARLYANRGWYHAVGVWLDEAVRLAPDDPQIWEGVVRLCLERGLTARGVEAAQRLVELRPESAVAYDLLGWAYLLNGDVEQAEDHLLKALRLDPGLASAYYHLGQVYAYRGEREKARTCFVRALDLPLSPRLRDRIEALVGGD